MGDITICTISKYPPYVAGPSFEAFYQGKALFGLTGRRPFQVTYERSAYGPATNVNDSPELLREAEESVQVYRVSAGGRNLKVFDGSLIKAFTGQVINLVAECNVNVLSTFYLDPHAYIANQAKAYAQTVLGTDVIIAHKAVGSDILNSVANHLSDGQGRFLLLQFLAGDIMLAVSQYTRDKLVEFAHELLPARLAAKIAEETKILYAPFDSAYFRQEYHTQQDAFKKKYQIRDRARVISYFGRLFPEKGVDDLLAAFGAVKQKYPDTMLVIGGHGLSAASLRQLARREGVPDVIFTGTVSNEEKRALMQLSCLGVLPTKPIPNFVETLCICALEYQAAGTPLVTTRVGGVPEAAGPHSRYAKPNAPQDLAGHIIAALGNEDERQAMIRAGSQHIRQFDYHTITKAFLRYVEAQKTATSA